MTFQQNSAPPPGAPLPVLEIAKGSFELLISNLRSWLAAAAIPLLIELALQYAFWTTYGPDMLRIAMQNAGSGAQGADPKMALHLLGMQLALLIAYVLFAVSWHRFALIGPAETPRAFPAVQARHMRFLLMSLGISLLLMLIAAVPLVILLLLNVQSVIALIFVVILLVTVFIRWQLIFPAIALDRRLTLAEAWRATRGQSLRLFWLFLLMVAPPALIRALIDNIFAQQVGLFAVTGELSLGAVLGFVLSGLMGYILLALLVGAISGSYRRLLPQ